MEAADAGYSPTHIQTSVETGNNPSRYGVTKYWGGKTSRVWSQYIEAYSRAGEVVLDPFCGQGIAIGEAVRLGRMAVGFDLQPSATFFTQQIFNRVPEENITAALEQLKISIGNQINELYATRNRSYQDQFDFSLMTDAWLKNFLKERGLTQSGSSDDLSNRAEQFNVAENDDERFALITNRGLRVLLETHNLATEGTREERINRLSNCGYQHPTSHGFSQEINAICFIASGSDKENETLLQVRYHDGVENVSVAVEQADIDRLDNLRNNLIFFTPDGDFRYQFPDQLLEYSTGSNFQEGRGYTNLSDWYTDRNMAALTALRHHISEITEITVREAFMHALISIVWQVSRTPPDRLIHRRGYSATMQLQSYYVPPEAHMEMNVWQQFKQKVSTGKETLIDAHADKNECWTSELITESFEELDPEERPAMIRNGDCLQMLEQLPDDCIDFILTDPPYGGSVQYGEIELSRSCWLIDEDWNLIAQSEEHEIIENQRQNKNSDSYYTSMRQLFQQCSRVLRFGRHMVLTFTHTGLRYRNMIYRAAALAGFRVERITWQEASRPSTRATWDEGIALEGDYYIRLLNNFDAENFDGNLAEIDNQTYEQHVKNVVIETIVHNAMPTPLNSLLSRVDGRVTELVMQEGLFPPLNSREMTEIISEEARILQIEDEEGGIRYWLTNPREYRLEIPLDHRMAGIISLAVSQGPRSYTEIHHFLMQAIRDELTPTRHDIVATLYELCQENDGLWSLRPEVEELSRMHEIMVYCLGNIAGRISSRTLAIASDERGKIYNGARLDSQLNLSPHPTDYGPESAGPVSRIDVIWMNNYSQITHCFEVENSTRIEGGIMRMSHARELPQTSTGSWEQVRRVIVVPDDRFDEARAIARSPMVTPWVNSASNYLLRYSVLEEFFSSLNDGDSVTLAQFNGLLEDMLPQSNLSQFENI